MRDYDDEDEQSEDFDATASIAKEESQTVEPFDTSTLTLDSSKQEPLLETPYGDPATWETRTGSPYDGWEEHFALEKAERMAEANLDAERIEVPGANIGELTKALAEAFAIGDRQTDAPEPSNLENQVTEYMRLKGETTPYTVEYPQEDEEES